MAKEVEGGEEGEEYASNEHYVRPPDMQKTKASAT
jgi:hypothetical protein